MKQRYKNLMNVPAPDGSRPKRLSLEVNSKGIITDNYWNKRYNEGALELIEDKEAPKSKPKTSTVQKVENPSNVGDKE